MFHPQFCACLPELKPGRATDWPALGVLRTSELLPVGFPCHHVPFPRSFRGGRGQERRTKRADSGSHVLYAAPVTVQSGAGPGSGRRDARFDCSVPWIKCLDQTQRLLHWPVLPRAGHNLRFTLVQQKGVPFGTLRYTVVVRATTFCSLRTSACSLLNCLLLLVLLGRLESLGESLLVEQQFRLCMPSAFSTLPLQFGQQKQISQQSSFSFCSASHFPPLNGQATCVYCLVATNW